MLLIDPILRRLSQNKITVLAFHKVPRQIDDIAPHEPSIVEFEQVLRFVKDRFPILALQDAVDQLGRGDLTTGAACLTFDDGYVDWIDTVVPLLKDYSIPATFFVTTEQFDGVPLWHERVRNVLLKAPNYCTDIGDPQLKQRIYLPNIKDRRQATKVFEKLLKTKPLQVREELICFLEQEVGVDRFSLPRLAEVHIKKLAAFGFEIGAHSIRHPVLSACDAADARAEIYGSKERLESILGKRIRYFAYPNGRLSDFSERDVDAVQKAGYEYAFTTESGAWTKDCEPLRIPRFTPWGPNSARMAWQIARNLL